jgi:outer membrane protein assembly factor BamB
MKNWSRLILVSIMLLLLGACSRLPLSSSEKFERFVGVRPQAVKPEHKIFSPAWIKNHDPAHSTGNLPIGLHEPLLHEGVVYIGDDRGYMRSYEAQTGRLLWSGRDQSSFHSGPIAYQDQIIYGTVQGRLISRHRTSGEVKFEIDLGSSVDGRAVISGGRVFVHLRNHQLFCLDAETGKILWAYRRSVPYQTTLQRVSTPLIDDQKLYLGFADGYVVALSLEDGLLLWERRLTQGEKFVDVDADPVLFMNQLLVGAGTTNANMLDPATGNISYQLPYTTNRRPLVLPNEQVILGTSDGKVVILSRELRELKSVQLKGSVTSVIFWGSYLVASTTAGLLYALEPNTFEILEHYEFGHTHSAVFGEMKADDETLVVKSSRNRLYAFKLQLN